MSNMPLSMSQIYRWPTVIALIILAGLLFALFGDGAWDTISWVLLVIPVFVIVCKLVINAR